MDRRTTTRQVAELAQVSPMTVSNVLRRRSYVAPDTRERVLRAVRELNYVPVRSTLQNRHVETFVLGLLCDYEITQKYGVNEKLINALSTTACAHGYDVLLHLRRDSVWGNDAQVANLLDRRTDGVIVEGLTTESENLSILEQHAISAVVCFNNKVPASFARVVLDNAGAMEDAVSYLTELGHRKIAHLTGPSLHSETEARAQGFRSALLRRNLECGDGNLIHPPIADWQALPTAETMRHVRSVGFTAVVCFNDSQALELWRLAEASGWSVPKDLSLIGLDNDLRGEVMGLTSITNPFEQVGRLAVESLLQLIQGIPPAECCHTLPLHLIVRRSAAKPSHARN